MPSPPLLRLRVLAHPVEQVEVVGSCGREDVDVLDGLVADRLDVVLDACGDDHERPGPDLVRVLADVVDRAALRDHRDLVELVAVRPDVHPRLAVVHDEQHVVGAEAAASHAGPHWLVGDLVPGDRLHGSLLSGGRKPSSAERPSAASRSAPAAGVLGSAGTEAAVPTSAIAAAISSPWNTGAASAAMPSTIRSLNASPASRTDASSASGSR